MTHAGRRVEQLLYKGTLSLAFSIVAASLAAQAESRWAFGTSLDQLQAPVTNMQSQPHVDNAEMDASKWRASVSQSWDVLGPFPIHAREQHYLSPSYPVNLSEPIDFNAQWPSAYADDGEVGWSKAQADGVRLAVSFPHIRWASLRATEGWAALQYHTVLHTSLTIYPPKNTKGDAEIPSHLSVDLRQGSFLTILPSLVEGEASAASSIPRWYAGNIYGLKASPTQVVPLPALPSRDVPTTYGIFISGDYEIRLFGDPSGWHLGSPEILIDLAVDIDLPSKKPELQPSHHVIPDFVSGWAFGQAIGIGLRASDDWWTVTEVSIRGAHEGVDVRLMHETRLAPTQTRIIPIVLTQTSEFKDAQLELDLAAVSPSTKVTLHVNLPVHHSTPWTASHFDFIVATYFHAISTPTGFVVIPPKLPNSGAALPPLLDIHGAGVDVLRHAAWDCAPPRQTRSWVIAPTGRTEWGLDWHGPSTQDVWASVEALSGILNQRTLWHAWSFAADTKVVVVGHSNGGQGTWYISARYPDRVLAAVPAAAYVKSQSYVSWVQSRSAHFVDPALRAILETSLTADDNDLFLTNLVNTPVLAIHGGDDENVPVWHTRALIDVLRTLKSNASVTFQEDPHKPHCYDSVFDNDKVQHFVDGAMLRAHEKQSARPWDFTLTVSIPAESDSLHGWRIHALEIPGRLAKLSVSEHNGAIFVSTRNVKVFSIMASTTSSRIQLRVDGQVVTASQGTAYFVQRNGVWELHDVIQDDLSQISGRLSLILNSRAPLLFVVSDKADTQQLQAALRLAQNLNVYHKLDASIVSADEVFDIPSQVLSHASIVAIGGAEDPFIKRTLELGKTPFGLRDGSLYLHGRPVDSDAASIFLHPHPTSPTSLMAVIYHNDQRGLERVLRLFPVRTGVTVPDWVVVGPRADSTGTGGVLAAGVWGAGWTWNEGMSSF